MSRPLATFTPSLVEPETLERLFVAREAVLADLVDRAREALASGARPHRMLIGPRGAGKTHLIALASHRIAVLDPAPTVAWLPEDPWMIDDYDDLLVAIHRAADERRGKRSPVFSTQVRVENVENALRARATERGPIVVLAENFERILETLGREGQRRLRRFMENERALLLLVTATRLGGAMLRQDGPFYGFFSTFELAPLDVDDAAEMLARIAEHRGHSGLAERLRVSRGSVRYRLAAIDALAGGQPRVWALLGSALTVEDLDALAAILVTRFDDLVPYYQEQLGRLAPQERKVVRALADLDRAVSVKALAETLGIAQRSLGKTVSTLRRTGWVEEVVIPGGVGDGRKTHVELAEPLARLAFRLKDNRGEPISMSTAMASDGARPTNV